MRNKKIKLISFLLILIILLSGCGSEFLNSDFTAIKDYGSGNVLFYHNTTKVVYLKNNHGAVTVLWDENGKPLLYDDYLKNDYVNYRK